MKRDEAVTKLKLVGATFVKSAGVMGPTAVVVYAFERQSRSSEWMMPGLQVWLRGRARHMVIEGFGLGDSGWPIPIMTGPPFMDGLNLKGQLASRPQVAPWENPHQVGTQENFFCGSTHPAWSMGHLVVRWMAASECSTSGWTSCTNPLDELCTLL